MNAFCNMCGACMLRLKAYLLGAQQREWVDGWGGGGGGSGSGCHYHQSI